MAEDEKTPSRAPGAAGEAFSLEQKPEKGTATPQGAGAGVLGKDYENCVHNNENNDLETPKISKWALQDTAARILPHERIHHCGKTITNQAQGVMIYRRAGAGVAYVKNTTVCGSVWFCPVCAAKISESRRVELQAANDQAQRIGWGVSLVTLTVPHGRRDNLAELLDKFSKAKRKLTSGRAYQAYKKKYGLRHEIRALEVTHGANGWHPHTHALVYSDDPLTVIQRDALKVDLHGLWVKACLSAGLGAPTLEHGVDVRGAENAAEYIGKWGFACELSKAHLKHGRNGSRTPWDLLRAVHNGDWRAAKIFREYADAFKGKRQLWWSRGLRAELFPMLGDDSDQELAERLPDDAHPTMFIYTHIWYRVLRNDRRAEFLNLIGTNPAAAAAILQTVAQDTPLGWGYWYDKGGG